MRRYFLCSVVLFLLLPAGGCRKESDKSTGARKLQIVTTLFPVYDFARTVGGDKVEVRLLLPPGVEPHNYEPKPEEVARISRAALFIYTDRYMEPWAATTLKGIAGKTGPLVIEAGQGVNFLPASPDGHDHGAHEQDSHGAMDPHIWLDPTNAQIMVDNIAAALMEKDPANANFYRTNAAGCKEQLTTLDEQFKTGLATCQKRTFLHGGHYAFAYLAKRYGLTYLSAYAVSANAEPTPQRMVELVKEMRRQKLKYIFTEELISPAVAETIARETGSSILKLHGVHNVSKADMERNATYFSLMEENLQALKTGLECP